MTTIEDVHNMHETFMQNHAARMTELNECLASINRNNEATRASQSETDATLDQTSKDLYDLLNSF